jgi:hypothetical protein
MRSFSASVCTLLASAIAAGAQQAVPPAFSIERIAVSAPSPSKIESANARYRIYGKFVVRNQSGYDIRNLTIKCTANSNGTPLPNQSFEMTILENFPTWGTKPSRELLLADNVDQQAAETTCRPLRVAGMGPYRAATAVPAGGDPADRAERFKTSERDLATPMINDPRNSRYLIPARREPVPRPFTPGDRIRR